MIDPPPFYLFCLTAGCDRTTEGGKPRCPDHVGRMPYVQDIRRRERRMCAEAEALRQGGPVRPRGALVAEVLYVLRGEGKPLCVAEVARRVRQFRRDSSLALRVLEVLETRRRNGARRAGDKGLWVAS